MGTPGATQQPVEKLVLTPQHRIVGREVLKLEPEHAVEPDAGWQEYEEPPLVLRDEAEPEQSDDANEDETPAPFVLEHAARSQPSRTDVTELTAKIAALESAIARTVDQWEPDDIGRDAYAGTRLPAMEWPENVDLDATGEPLAVSKTAPVPSTTADSAAEEALEVALEEQVIDEETLRALVGEIVRAELQGALGERITRNVRKLVRREIHRVLIAQRLE